MISDRVLICIVICLAVVAVCKIASDFDLRLDAQRHDVYTVTIYRSQKGETLNSIARDFKIDYTVLVNFNPEIETGLQTLPEGTFVKIPQFKI